MKVITCSDCIYYKASGWKVKGEKMKPYRDEEGHWVAIDSNPLINAMSKVFEQYAEERDLVEVVRQPVKGYEGQYEVDQFGRVFSVDRTIRVENNGRTYEKLIKGRQMRQAMHTKGYKVVALTKDGKTTSYFVHRIVAEAFIPNPNNLPFVNHKDEDKTNNFAENLEWCTAQYNSTYGKARYKQSKAIKGRPLTNEHKKKISESLKRHYRERREDAEVHS